MFHGHVILLEDLVAVDFPSSYHWENQTPSANSRIFQIFLGKTYQVSYTSYKYIYISLYSVYIYISYLFHISHPHAMPIDRGSRRSRRFHPYPQLPRPLHTRVSRLSWDRPTVVGGMWRLRAATSAAPAGLRWVKSSGLLQNNVENLWLFRMKHDRWLGVHIELQEGWDQNDHGKK